MKVSIEAYLLDNLMMNYLVLRLACTFFGARAKQLWLFAASLLGAVYALLSMSVLPILSGWIPNELLLSDILGTENDVISRDIEDEVDRELLRAALIRLTPRERTIVELRFGLNDHPECTQKQVADLLGISQSYISRLEKRIIKRLQREMLRMQ